MGSIADTYEKKEVMRDWQWRAAVRLDYLEWKELNRQGTYDLYE